MKPLALLTARDARYAVQLLYAVMPVPQGSWGRVEAAFTGVQRVVLYANRIPVSRSAWSDQSMIADRREQESAEKSTRNEGYDRAHVHPKAH